MWRVILDHNCQQSSRNDDPQHGLKHNNVEVWERARSNSFGSIDARQDTQMRACVNTTDSPTSGPFPNEALVGAPTGAGFMLQVALAVEDRSGQEFKEKGPQTKPAMALPRVRPPLSGGATPAEMHLVLPTKRTADELFGIYWDLVSPVFPYLDKHVMSGAYETLWVNNKSMAIDMTTFHCTLNLVFALAWMFGPFEGSRQQAESASIFHARAEKLMLCNLLEVNTLETIQVLLLSALYHQCTSMPRKSIDNIDLAIHAAKTIGLHLPVTIGALTSPDDRDLARRVWHGCIIMDRQIAMTFGCALKISQSMAKDAAYPSISTVPAFVPTDPYLNGFHKAYYELYHILGDVLEFFYLPKSDSDSGVTLQARHTAEIDLLISRLSRVLRIESDLSCWREKLPPKLLPGSDFRSFQNGRAISLQVTILHTR
ncbi:hypothetical protein ARSEF1564_004238 [Beauveria bassiana]